MFKFINFFIIFISGMIICGCLTRQNEYSHENALLLKEVLIPEYNIVTVADQNFEKEKVFADESMRYAVDTGNWKDVEKKARKMLEKHPFNPAALSLMSVVYLHQNEHDKALYFAKMASQKRSDLSFYLNMKGLVALKSASMAIEFQHATSLFRKALSENSHLWSARLNYGYLLLKLGQKKEALREFRISSGHCNNCFPSLMGTALSQLRIPDSEEKGVSTMHQLMKENPGVIEIPYELGIYYFSKGNKKEATKMFNRIKNNPKVSTHAGIKNRIISLEKIL